MTDIRYINIRGRTVTMLIAFLPVLSMYGVGLGESISAFDFLLVVLVIFLGVYSLFHGSIQGVYNKKEILLFPFLLYMIFGLIFHLLDGFNESLFLKTGRLILYFIFIIVYLRGSFSSLNGYKLLEILALFVVFYLCFQNVVLLLFNYYVPGFLTFIPVLRGELFDHSETGGGISFRARSILGEPSEIGLVVGLYLLITLLLMEKYRIQSFVMKFKVAFASFGLVISLSATGAAMLFLSWLSWLIVKIASGKGYFKYSIYISGIAVVAFLVTYIIIYDVDMSRLNQRLGLKDYGNVMLWYNLDLVDKVFGVGVYGREVFSSWTPSSVRILFYFGIIGFVFYYFSLLMMGFSLSLIGKILLIMYIVLSFVTQSGLSVWTVFFMAYIISLSDLEMKLNRDPGVLFGR